MALNIFSLCVVIISTSKNASTTTIVLLPNCFHGPLAAPLVTAVTNCVSNNRLLRLNNLRGVIQTRDGTSYSQSMDCRWTISSNTKLQLQFASFMTCSPEDYVTVHDGNSLSAPLIGRFSGSSVPAPIASSTNKLYVRFVSNGSRVTWGFKAFYQGIVHGFLKTSFALCNCCLIVYFCLLSQFG